MAAIRFSRTDLEQLERQLKSWRRSRGGPCRLPQEVWEAAVALVGRHGLSRVARSLGLDYHKLQRLSSNSASLSAAKSAPRCPPGFVEMPHPSRVAVCTGCRVEFRNGPGAMMAVDLPHDTAAVLRLVEAFWRLS